MNEPPIDIQFNPSGYLFLATEERAAMLEENVNIQRYGPFIGSVPVGAGCGAKLWWLITACPSEKPA